MRMPKVLILWKGVARRLFLYCLHRKYVEESIQQRKGACKRCGACCRLFLKKCVYLNFDQDGNALCLKYKGFRMPNCRIFPIDKRDITDRDMISETPCGFYFGEEPGGAAN
jgi:hypothetical protein